MGVPGRGARADDGDPEVSEQPASFGSTWGP
jgi:hypothetical protein